MNYFFWKREIKLNQIKFNHKVAFVFSLLYQVYPYLLVKSTLIQNPSTSRFILILIILLCELALFSIVYTWKKSSESEVIDERERLIRNRIDSFGMKVFNILFILLFIYSFFINPEISGKLILGMMAVPIVLAEIFANYYFRKF